MWYHMNMHIYLLLPPIFQLVPLFLFPSIPPPPSLSLSLSLSLSINVIFHTIPPSLLIERKLVCWYIFHIKTCINIPIFNDMFQCLLRDIVFIGHWLTGKKSYQSFWKIIGQYCFLWLHQQKIYRSLTDFKLKLSVISDFNRSLTDDRALK